MVTEVMELILMMWHGGVAEMMAKMAMLVMLRMLLLTTMIRNVSNHVSLSSLGIATILRLLLWQLLQLRPVLDINLLSILSRPMRVTFTSRHLVGVAISRCVDIRK